MLKDISNFVKKCKQCQHTNTKTETTLPIGIDLIGPIDKEKGLPLSDKGYRYV